MGRTENRERGGGGGVGTVQVSIKLWTERQKAVLFRNVPPSSFDFYWNASEYYVWKDVLCYEVIVTVL